MHLFRSMLHRMLLGIAFAITTAGIAAAQDLRSTLPVDPNVATGKLSNGLTYYIRNNHKPDHKVELRLVVKAGSILENDDQQGLAHFMEHMNFNGTKNFQKNDLVSYLQSIGVQFGADLNAYTSFDQTVYILPIPTDKPGNLEKGFQIIEDWSHNALLTDKDIDEERGVVLEESRLGKGAQDRMRKKYFPKLAEGTLYAERLPIGKDDILKTFKYKTIRDFYHDWYRPDLQAVIVVGDIDTATAKKMIMDHFANIKNPANERERKYVDVNPRKAPDAMVVTDKEATNPVLILTYPYVKKHEETTLGDYRQDIVKGLAQSILTQRLMDLAQGDNPPFPYAGVGTDDLVHGYEAFQVFAVLTPNGTEKALNTVTSELEKAQNFGVTESELDIAKKEALSGIEKSYNERNTTESKSYVSEYIRAFLDKEPFPGIANEYNYYKELLPGITVSDVNAAINKWMANPNTFALITGPDKADMKYPTDKELLEMTEKGFAQKVEKPEEKTIAKDLMTTKPAPGKVVSQVKEEGLDATTYTLSNGVKVTIKTTDFKSDEILMHGIKKGGTDNFGLADKSNVKFAADIVDAMGVGAFTPNDLEKVLAGKKIDVSTDISDFTSTVKASSTVKDFESMLQLTYLYLTQPRKDEALFKAYKEKQIAEVQNMMANPRVAYIDTTLKVLYKNNPLARTAFPRPEDYDKINLDRALEIYKNDFSSADGYHFFIVGNINAETALPLLETYLGSLPAQGKQPAIKDNGVRPITGIKEIKVHKGSEKQSLILEIFGGEMPYSEDLAFKEKALTDALNIKVIEILREKMSAIYGGGFNGSFSKEPYAHYSIQLQLPCGPENVDRLLPAAKKLVEDVKQKGPEKKDLDKVKNTWKEKYLTDVKENKFWESSLESVLFWGRDKDRVLHYEKYVDKLTPADVQATAKKLFNGKNQFTSILYPEK